MADLLTNTPVYRGTTRTRAMYKGGTKVWPPPAAPAGGGPEQISGCVLALNGVDVPDGPVTSWSDRTASHNNMVPIEGTPTAVDGVVTVTSASVLGSTSPIPVTGNVPRHLIALVRTRHTAGAFLGYGSAGNGQMFDLWNYNPGTLIWHGYGGGYDTVAGAPAYTADEWHVIECWHDGTSLRVAVDEYTSNPTAPTSPLFTTATQLWLGKGRYNPGGDFDIKSLYFYDRMLTSAERAQVRAQMLAEPEPAWAPSDLTGLAIWLDAADYQSGSWPNKAVGGAPTVWRGSPSPVWASTTKNGLPVVRFTVNEARLRIHSGSGVHLDWTVVYVARMVGPSAGRIVNAIYNPNNLLVGFWNGNQDVMYDNGFASNGQGVPVVLGAWKLYTGDGTTGLSQLYSNGALLGSTSTSQGWGNTFSISGYDPDGAAETCDCEVAEVLQYSRKLSDEERQQVETYLREKWAIT